jgi:hypothetical protein
MPRCVGGTWQRSARRAVERDDEAIEQWAADTAAA